MKDSPEDDFLMDELAPFLEAGRSRDDPETIPPEHLADMILGEHCSGTGQGRDRKTLDPLPRSFGPYELRTVLGRGGSGTVYAGYDPELQRQIAIKILAPELAALPASRERFLREAQAAAQLQHDHIMPIFAVHQDTELPCLIMPLLEGRTLQQLIDGGGPLPADEIARIGAELAAALQTAHEAGYVHRDVKPSNVFLEDAGGRVRLMDFGLAKGADAEGLTQPGVLAGTPEYLAPEQLEGLEPTPRSDLYGLGATLYAMAASRPPFTGSSLASLLKKITQDPPPPLGGELPASLRSVVDLLLQKDPELRPASAEEVSAALSGESPRPASSRPVSRSLRWLAGSAGALGLAIALFTLFRPGPPGSSPPGVQPPLDDTAALTAALQQAVSGSTLTLTTAGEYRLDPLDLRDLRLTIEASEPDTVLVWTSETEPGIRSTGDLVFKNLVLRQEPATEADSTPPLIEFGGARLRFEACRLEQPYVPMIRVGPAMLLAIKAPSTVTLRRSQVKLFASTFLHCDHPGAVVTMEECLAFVPRLWASERGGTLRAVDCSFATHLLVSAQGTQAVLIEPDRCYLQATFAPLWLPGLQSDESMDARVEWKGRGNVYSSRWLFLFTNQVAPGRRALNQIPREYHWPEFSDWVSYWGSRDEGAQQIPRPLVRPTDTPGTLGAKEIFDDFQDVAAEGVGVDPPKTGPFGAE